MKNNRKQINSIFASALLSGVAAMTISCNALAQTRPDAGRTVQEITAAPAKLTKTPSLNLELKANGDAIAGGVKTNIKTISFEGNTIFDNQELLMALGDLEKEYDFAGLKNLAQVITSYYHSKGYPFARAFLPPQNMTSGLLKINVVEGRYGKIKAVGDDSLTDKADKFLNSLKTGETIASSELERATLILNDQSGIEAVPTIRPGEMVGTGDLEVAVKKTKKWGGEASLDNQGNRYTGKYRGSLNMYLNSPFLFGDKLSFNTLYTSEDMWFGDAYYELPLGYSGLRGNIGYAHTRYELGKEFANLDATGFAKISSVGLSYPLKRSQKANVVASIQYQYKDLQDKYGVSNTTEDKYVHSVPMSLQFDVRDSLFGGGITYGSLSWSRGQLHLDNALKATDVISARSDGDFNKGNLDIARLQMLVQDVSLWGRLSTQVADKNLDSSEGFGLGGVNGVRAYPTGEAYGDEGWLIQTELRYNIKNVTSYAFYDAGSIKVNAKNWTTDSNTRDLEGLGIGLRFDVANWNVDTSLAWRTNGGKPESDSKDNIPMFWAKIKYSF